MNTKFDEFAKSMAQSTTRRGALRKFGVAIAGMALAFVGLANKAEANPHGCLPSSQPCRHNSDCCSKRCVNADQGFGPLCA